MPEVLGPLFLVTRRVAEMAAFYEEIVDLAPARREEGHHVWFRLGDLDLAIHVAEDEPGPDFTPKDRGTLMWFRCDRDLDAVASELRARGAPCWGPYDGGVRRLLLTFDPDENMVGLFQTRSETV